MFFNSEKLERLKQLADLATEEMEEMLIDDNKLEAMFAVMYSDLRIDENERYTITEEGQQCLQTAKNTDVF